MKYCLLCIISVFLSSCVAYDTFLKGSKLQVQSVNTSSIFLNPIRIENKKAYVHIRNTSGIEAFEDIKHSIKKNLQNKGYTIVSTPSEAQVLLQANIRYYGNYNQSAFQKFDTFDATPQDPNKNGNDTKHDKHAANNVIVAAMDMIEKHKPQTDYSSVALFGAAGFFMFDSVSAALGGGIFGAVLSKTLNKVFETEQKIIITDVQISELSENAIYETDYMEYQQGDSNDRKSNFSNKTWFQNYRTRNATIMDGRNLDNNKESQEIAIHKISQSLSELI